jgi:hypothetical protein
MTKPDEIPTAAQNQLQQAINTALERPDAAQGFLGSIPDLSKVGDIKDTVLSAITGILGAIDTLQQYAWIIPDQYEEPIQRLEDALNKVRGWLD